MAGRKISLYPSGSVCQAADELILARGGLNFKLAASEGLLKQLLLPTNNSLLSNPVAAATYACGSGFILGFAGAVSNLFNRVYFRKPARVLGIGLEVGVLGALDATGNLVPVNFRVNDAVSTLVHAGIQYNAIGPTVYNNLALDVTLDNDDFFELLLGPMPAFGPNPTNILHCFSVYYL